MGLIIKNALRKMFKGYPTVSDKYNVAGGTVEGATAIQFGELVEFGSSTGYYKAITGAITVDKIAGISLATNVKLATTYPADNEIRESKTGEQINLLLSGYVCVELDSAAVEANVKEGAKVAVILATGKMTTSGVADTANLPNYTFTGEYEKIGSTILAEIKVGC